MPVAGCVRPNAMAPTIRQRSWAVIEKFGDYLPGSEFTIYTDNNLLTYLMKKEKLPALEHRWASALAPFNFDNRYRAARHDANADAL